MLSACLIVRDEAKVLARCLQSLQGVADEIVVVDTGSTDESVALARTFGARIGFFAWCDDFAAARNASLELATGDWILQIDADEELGPGEGPRLRARLEQEEFQAADSAYVLLRNLKEVPPECLEGASLPEPFTRPQSCNHLIRLFRRAPYLRYTGILHETLRGARRTLVTDLSILHYGYAAGAEVQQRRFERNRRLSRKHLAQDPENPAVHFYAGATCQQGALREEAEEHFLRTVELCQARGEHFEHFLLNALARLAHLAGQRGDFPAMRQFAEQALARDPGYLDPWLRLGEALYHLGHFWPAERALRRFLEIRRELDRRSPPLRYTLYLLGEEPQAQYLLGRLAEEREDWEAAERYYRRSFELDPHGPHRPGEALEQLSRRRAEDP